MSDDTVRRAIEALRGPTHPGDPEAEQVVQELHQLCGQHAQELHVQHPQIPYEQLYDSGHQDVLEVIRASYEPDRLPVLGIHAPHRICRSVAREQVFSGNEVEFAVRPPRPG